MGQNISMIVDNKAKSEEKESEDKSIANRSASMSSEVAETASTNVSLLPSQQKKNGFEADQYEQLPDNLDAPIIADKPEEKNSLMASLMSWWSPQSKSFEKKPKPFIRPPEDQDSKVKWNALNYDTLQLMAPSSEEIFLRKNQSEMKKSPSKK